MVSRVWKILERRNFTSRSPSSRPNTSGMSRFFNIAALCVGATAHFGCARPASSQSGGMAFSLAERFSVQTDGRDLDARPEDNGRVFVGLSVESQDALPACDRSLTGRIVYVAADKAFLTCQEAGEWRRASADGEGAWQGAFEVYQKLRGGIVRIAIQCQDKASTKSTFVGTGFHCAKGVICTSGANLACPEDSNLVRVNLHRLMGDDGATPDMPPPFFSILDSESALSRITRHPELNLAKLRLPSSDPGISDMPVLPWAESPLDRDAPSSRHFLSMSFPLGFTTIYAHLGSLRDPAGKADDGQIHEFITTNDTDKGSCGSPLFRLDGRVVGVVVDSDARTSAIDASLLSAF